MMSKYGWKWFYDRLVTSDRSRIDVFVGEELIFYVIASLRRFDVVCDRVASLILCTLFYIIWSNVRITPSNEIVFKLEFSHMKITCVPLQDFWSMQLPLRRSTIFGASETGLWNEMVWQTCIWKPTGVPYESIINLLFHQRRVRLVLMFETTAFLVTQPIAMISPDRFWKFSSTHLR